MSAGQRCPGCGSSNIVEDDLYCQAQLVCADCGSVLREGVLADDPYGGSDVSYSRTTAVSKKPCVNLIRGLQRLRAISRTLRLNGEIELLAESHYSQAYQHESFIQVSLQKKELLAGCCVLVSCRLLNWPMTMGTISCLLDADPAEVGAVYRQMVKILNIQTPIVNITDVMEAHSQEYKLSSGDVPEELAEDPRDLAQRAVALVELAANAWIVTGRRPVPVMMAAVFLAWQSLKPTKHRLKLSLDKFCQLAKVNKHKPALKRVSEIKEVLCKLGEQIPWLRETLTPENVLTQVEDILTHRHTLLQRALRSYEAPETSEPRGDHPDAEPQPPADTDGVQSPGPAAEWRKRVLLAPPCVIHAKRRRVEQQRGPDVTGDEEISDSEIESYIRSPQEVRVFTSTQRRMSDSKRP